jgi:hypothetical protein
MYFNPKFGNFGMLVLPFGLSAFFLGLYSHRRGQILPFLFVSYFMLYGLVVPVWLARALWGAARSRPASWR